MVSNVNSAALSGDDYRTKYKRLKHQLKQLIYENENFQTILRQAQQKYVSAIRDRNFLLDRLVQFEKISSFSSDSDPSDNSDEEKVKQEPVKRKRSESTGGSQSAAKRRKQANTSKASAAAIRKTFPTDHNTVSPLLSEGQLTPEEVERHLQSRQSFLELLPCRAPPTVPSELFSNDPSLDSFCFSESNELETSPDIGDDSYSIEVPDVPE